MSCVTQPSSLTTAGLPEMPLAVEGAVPGRRRNLSLVRSAQLATGLLVAVAVLATITTRLGYLSAGRVIGLAIAGAVYVGWSLYGTRDAAHFVQWDHRLGPVRSWPAPGRRHSILHLSLQFGLAELIIWLAAPAAALNLLWLVLLPPVGFAVMFLRPTAVAAVCFLSAAAHAFNVVHWHGWEHVPLALSGFSVAVAFAVVFTRIAVSAEQARAVGERLAAELGEANVKLREHALQAEELAATRERNRLAREIHDGLGQYLTVIHVQLEAAYSTLGSDPATAASAIDKARSMNQVALQEVRRSVSTLRTSPLQDRPLDEALRQLVAENGAAGLHVEWQVLGSRRALSPQAALTVYRAAQEGLTNCRKHSGVSAARMMADYREPERVRLTVSDDGAGSTDAREGFGLLGLKERAHLVGGTVAVRTTPGQGFALEVEVPG
jgi:signal transduction histidine kinase